MEFLFIVVLIIAIIFWVKKSAAEKVSLARNETIQQQSRRIVELESQLAQKTLELAKYKDVIDAEDEAKRILTDADVQSKKLMMQANETLSEAKSVAESERKKALLSAQAKIDQADEKLRIASEEVDRIIAMAKQRAEEIAGDAYSAMSRAKEFTDTAQAMKNIIDGYGDAYIVPSFSLLDDLADEFGHAEAGQKLKEAREISRSMVKAGIAATCDYVEANRKETAIRFVVDAFNGKVDSILSRSKADNHGKLEREILDAFSLVNHNGSAFRNAKITEQYLSARLAELKWAATVFVLKEEEREEQRRLREQIREEEKARREYERAIKDAAKEEESIKKAMEKVQQQVAAANEAQRAEFEAKLNELQDKLKAAEEKNQRALSMAQQTRTGHVYVISNIGSFGEDVFKIGLTRRLEPTDRVRELGDASVPFEFDIHAMIYSEDAPTLEKKLHRHFLRNQINKVNPRKEFFRLGLEDIRREVESLGVVVHWTMAAEAQHYRESLRIEQQLIENPALAQEWSRQQLEFEPSLDEAELELPDQMATLS